MDLNNLYQIRINSINYTETIKTVLLFSTYLYDELKVNSLVFNKKQALKAFCKLKKFELLFFVKI